VSLDSHPSANKWRRTGKRLFLRQFREQFSRDGSYILHSTNYEREALRISLIFVRSLQLSGEKIPDWCSERLARAAIFLFQLSDEKTGRVPNYGANDGTNLMPLSSIAYEDFRGAIQTTYYLATGTRALPSGPYDEDLVWWFNTDSPSSPLAPLVKGRFAANDGGYFTFTNEGSWGFIRCHSFRTRPGHADLLHFDLWANGSNIVGDGGTFLYSDPTGIGQALKSTAAHNTVTVDGRSQMTEAGQFLWVHWTRAYVISEETQSWSGEHHGYAKNQRGIVHRRTIFFERGQWAIVDDLINLDGEVHLLDLWWHLRDHSDWQEQSFSSYSSKSSGFTVQIFGGPTPPEVQTFFGRIDNTKACYSKHYGNVKDSMAIKVSIETSVSYRFVTVFSPNNSEESEVDGNKLRWLDNHISLDPNHLE